MDLRSIDSVRRPFSSEKEMTLWTKPFPTDQRFACSSMWTYADAANKCVAAHTAKAIWKMGEERINVLLLYRDCDKESVGFVLKFWIQTRSSLPGGRSSLPFRAPSRLLAFLPASRHPAGSCVHRDYGQTEFFLTDNNGYSLCFGVVAQR